MTELPEKNVLKSPCLSPVIFTAKVPLIHLWKEKISRVLKMISKKVKLTHTKEFFSLNMCSIVMCSTPACKVKL